MKMAALVILIPPMVVLGFTAIAAAGPGLEYVAADTGEVKGNLNNPGAHGFSEMLYALLVGRQQQRQCVRRADRERAVLQHDARAGDARLAVLADDSGAGDCRLAGAQRSSRPPGWARCRRTRRCSS